MADISISNQAGVRKNFYEFPSDVAAALIHAGIAVPIPKAAPAPTRKPHWFVGTKPNGSLADYVLCWSDGNGAVMYFTGTPESYLKSPPVHCGLEAPRAVLEQYARLLGATTADPEWVREKLLQQKAADATRQQKEKEQMHRWM